MALKTTNVSGVDVQQLVDQIYSEIHQDNEKLVMYFVSPAPYDFEDVSKKLTDKFPNVEVVGCSTAGEIHTGQGIVDGSITAISFGEDKVGEVAVFEIDLDRLDKCEEEFRAFKTAFVKPTEIEHYVGITLIDGSSHKEESLMDKLGNAAPELILVGGSAGDGMSFGATFVAHNGKTMHRGAVIPLLRMKTKYAVIQTSSYKASNVKFVATKTSPEKRLIHEINGINAVEFYKQIVPAEVYDFGLFATHPIGIEIEGGNAFVRSLQSFTDDGSLLLYCAVDEGTQLCLLEPIDIIEDMNNALTQGIENVGGSSGGILFSCILQKIEMLTLAKQDEFIQLLDGRNLAGFFTYGEHYIAHMNQTLTGLLIE
jgi:hypothetical protein